MKWFLAVKRTSFYLTVGKNLSLAGSTMTANVCKKITAQLTGAIGKQEDVSVQLEALDILSDMLSRYQRISFWQLRTAGGCMCVCVCFSFLYFPNPTTRT